MTTAQVAAVAPPAGSLSDSSSTARGHAAIKPRNRSCSQRRAARAAAWSRSFAFTRPSATPSTSSATTGEHHATTAGQSPSRPGESHPRPLTEPDANLSIHPARAIQPTVGPQAASARRASVPAGRSATGSCTPAPGCWPAVCTCVSPIGAGGRQGVGRGGPTGTGRTARSS